MNASIYTLQSYVYPKCPRINYRTITDDVHSVLPHNSQDLKNYWLWPLTKECAMDMVESTNRQRELMRCINQLNDPYQCKVIELLRPSLSSAPPTFKAQSG